MQQGAVHRYVRKLMALPFLPAEHISAAFELLEEQATTGKLKDIVDYIDNTWIKSTVWPMKSWRQIMTWKDTTYIRINSRASRGNMSYSLVALLHRFALHQYAHAPASRIKSQRKQVSRCRAECSRHGQHMKHRITLHLTYSG